MSRASLFRIRFESRRRALSRRAQLEGIQRGRLLLPQLTIPHSRRWLLTDGVDPELDECRALQRDGTAWLTDYQQRLGEETGIGSLKIGFNKVFGYYLELTNAHKDKAPDYFIRKQTLKNAERYITPELKEHEEEVLRSAEQPQKRCAILRPARALKREFPWRPTKGGIGTRRTKRAVPACPSGPRAFG